MPQLTITLENRMVRIFVGTQQLGFVKSLKIDEQGVLLNFPTAEFLSANAECLIQEQITLLKDVPVTVVRN